MRFTNEEKLKYLENWRESKKSAWAYAKEKGINAQTFINWTRKTLKKDSCFVEVPVKIKQQSSKPEILIEKSDMKIHIPLNLNSNELRTVMEGLGVSL